VIVALAGPFLNIVLAGIAGLALRIATHSGATLFSANSLPAWTEWLFAFGEANVVIAVFNLIPIPPLDGSALVERILPAAALPGYYRLRPYAMLFVLALVLFDQGLLSSLFNHAFNIWARIWIPQA
jgi:Zn-dependent protease